MNAIAFRNSLTKLLLDARKTEWDAEEDDATEIYGETTPSPDEIRRRCLEIQKEWSVRERTKRAGVFARHSTWSPPIVSVSELD